jgi:FAD/FMN-containing dehydrogenase
MPDPTNAGALNALADSLGADRVLTVETARHYFASDLFYDGEPPCAVVIPDTVAHLRAAVKGLTGAGLAVVPRGGGMSYSAGYVTNHANAVLIDTRDLNRITEINAEDMYVTVETGVTWAELDAALKPLGLRTPFWGTGSGKHATVGASLAQNAINYGSGQYGFAAQWVTGLEVVTADGSLITTGTGGNDQNPSPFLRHYGPDLTGLFLGDCGALGIKARATLQLIQRPAVTLYAAYDFGDSDSFCAALSNIARCQAVSECFGFDPGFTTLRTTHVGLKDGLKMLSGIAKEQASIAAGLKEALKVAAAGRRYLEHIGYSIHIAVDGRDQGEAESRLAAATKILSENGREIEASIPKVMRGTPFPDPTIILGHQGERWVPMHGIVPHSRLRALLRGLDTFMDSHAPLIDEHDIVWAITAVPAGPSGILVEPNLYWRDARTALIKDSLPDSYLNDKPVYEEDRRARAAVKTLREGMIDVFRAQGAGHMQIGRVYPFLASRNAETRSLLNALKAHLDPNGQMNPGSLGL